MNRAVELRVTNGLQLLGILALLISIIVLFAAADQLGTNRKQITLANEVTQVLVELRQLASAQPDGASFSDDAARLIGYGDVQTNEISAMPDSGLFSREEVDLKTAKAVLMETWQAAKKSFATGNGSITETAFLSDNSPQNSQRNEGLRQFSQLREAFDKVFAAIAQDTLSAELLAANSQMLATLKNVDFVLSNRDSLNATAYQRLLQESLSAMQVEVTRLISLTAADGGGILIGYDSKQLLSRFALQSKTLGPVLLAEPEPTEVRFIEDQQSALANAINGASGYRQLLDFASHQNRRAILFSITALCLALICLMLSLWRSYRNQISGQSSGNQDLERLRVELTAIADGNLNVRASQQSSASLSAIAQAANHTVEMLTGLVQVFRRAGNHLNELAGSQQHLAKRWIKSEIKQHEKLELLAQNLEFQSRAIDQLQ